MRDMDNIGEAADLLLDDLEGLFQELSEFSAGSDQKPEDITQSLERYLRFVAKSGNTVFPWQHVRLLFRIKILQAMDQFPGELCPDSEAFVLERFDLFRAAPFTIQRLTELITQPTRHYKKKEKFLRGLEKTVLVVSTITPYNSNDAVVEAEEEEISSVMSVNVSLNVTIEMETNSTESVDTADPVSTTVVETFQEALFVSSITSYNSNDAIAAVEVGEEILSVILNPGENVTLVATEMETNPVESVATEMETNPVESVATEMETNPTESIDTSEAADPVSSEEITSAVDTFQLQEAVATIIPFNSNDAAPEVEQEYEELSSEVILNPIENATLVATEMDTKNTNPTETTESFETADTAVDATPQVSSEISATVETVQEAESS